MLHIITDETDLFAVREEPLVGVEDLFGPSFFIMMRNFDLSSKDGIKDGGRRCVVIALTPAPIGVPTKIFRAPHIADTISYCRQHKQNT